ncbi:MAG: hypothetical protein Q7R96_01745 [Nanoarchaeota archaeon]|nr:hypothetical protein [Nanoarchaeota archaeon]
MRKNKSLSVCEHIKYYTTHEDHYLISLKDGSYGIRIAEDLGGGAIIISYCPWCGKKITQIKKGKK